MQNRLNCNPLILQLITGIGVLALATITTLWLLNTQTVHGAGFIVDSTADTVDVNPGDGICADSNGNCTLRAAIIETNALPGPDVITFSATGSATHTVGLTGSTTYTIGLTGSGADTPLVGDFDINDGLTIIGNGQNVTIIDGNSLDRVFDIFLGIFNPGSVEISGVTIQNGDSGGIRSK